MIIKNTLYSINSSGKRFISNFIEKADYSILFFLKQCSLTDNGCEILYLEYPKTDKSLSNNTFLENDIEKVMQNLDLNKVHGQYMINIQMLKICGKSIIKTFLTICKK